MRERLLISGDRKGHVTVKEAVSGHVRYRFQMETGVVRELYLLDNGNTLVATQKDHTVFWDLATGSEIRRFDQRIYGFSNNETLFFTYNTDGVFLHAYPSMKGVCQLCKGPMLGPDAHLFSPNDQFLAILFSSGRPSSDSHYPRSNPVFRGNTYSKLFDLLTCQEIQEFSKLDVVRLGEFSSDSTAYDLKEAEISLEGRRLSGAWRFDLTNKNVTHRKEEDK